MLAGCAGGSPGPADPAALAAVARFDGVYQGQQIPAGQLSGCRAETRGIWFRVQGGEVELSSSRRRHKATSRPMMAGTVAADGALALNRDGTDRMAAGQIVGDGLSATEVINASAFRTTGNGCTYRYEATRVSRSAD